MQGSTLADLGLHQQNIYTIDWVWNAPSRRICIDWFGPGPLKGCGLRLVAARVVCVINEEEPVTVGLL